MRIHYDKLVRDAVPEAIRADGHDCLVEVLAPDAYVAALKRKLVEEAHEALAASERDDLLFELADLLEVIVSLADASNISRETLEATRLRRHEQRGGFERRLFLRFVDRKETSG